MLAEYFHKKYYSDLPIEDVESAIYGNEEMYNKAVDFIYNKHYPDLNKTAFQKVVAGKKPIKIKNKTNTLPQDNTNLKKPVVDLRTPLQKQIDVSIRKKQQELAKKMQNVVVQTALDQNPIGQKLNTLNDIKEVPEFDNKLLGVANTIFNDVKTGLPVLGDFFVNTAQEAIKYFDNESKDKLDKSTMNQITKNKIKNKPFGVQNEFN